MEKDSIRINTQSEFHMLRHFSGHREAYIQYFTAHGKTVSEIEKELNEIASRFVPDFASSIAQIIDRVFSFSAIADALAYAEFGNAKGKTIIQMT